MNDMIIRNRNFGLESMLQTAEERAPRASRTSTTCSRSRSWSTPPISFKKAAGFDVETVNSREFFVERPSSPP